MPTLKQSPKSTSQLSKGLATLRILSTGDRSAAEVAKLLGANRSTALRLLRELEALGYVRKDAATRRYRVVRETVYGLLPREPSGRNAADEIREIVLRARDATREAAMFAVMAEDRMVYMEFVPALLPVSVQEERGTTRPMLTSAVGRAYLAGLPEQNADAAVARLRDTEAAAFEGEAVDAMLAQVRAQGYAVDRDETIDGVSCVAIPLVSRGLLVGAMGVTAPSDRLDPARIREVGERLLQVPSETNPSYAAWTPHAGTSRPSSPQLTELET